MPESSPEQLLPSLEQLKPGQSALVAGFDEGAPLLKRLQELGFLPGARVKVLRRALLGDPIQVEIAGSLLSVRKREARQIRVEIQPAAAESEAKS